ncbi:MAG: LON peptidase substrate-binding domain-containing protein [Blastocatellia bacterium]|nr:LON peptidase substrate-binding domain-containing protein [Blastocatellia bacterium]
MSSENFVTKRQLSLFPLPLVLMPGSLLPLHIFEERYKLMIRRCLDTDKVFGITYQKEGSEWPPPIGMIGGIAQIMAVVPLEEGRMNILTAGGMRFRVLEYIEEKPYLIAEVEVLQDDLEEQEPTGLIIEIKTLYEQVADALRELNEEQLPDLPESAEELSFTIASSIRLKDDVKQEFMEIFSTKTRLQYIKKLLLEIKEKYVVQADMHKRAKLNGHGSHKVLNKFKDE